MKNHPLLLGSILASLTGATYATEPQNNVEPYSTAAKNLNEPYGIKLGTTKCSEYAEKIGISAREITKVGALIKNDASWRIKIFIPDCEKPDTSINSVIITYFPSIQVGQKRSEELSQALFDGLMRGISDHSNEWVEVLDAVDAPAYQSRVFKSKKLDIELTAQNKIIVLNINIRDEKILRAARIQESAVKPFGIAVGISTCQDASAIFGTAPRKAKNSQKNQSSEWVQVITTSDAGRHYPNATRIEANCFLGPENPVDDISVYVKDSANNSTAREVFNVLNRKYKKVEGRQIPSHGAGYARFSAPMVEIELEAPSNGMDFSVTYTESKLFTTVQKMRQQQRDSL